MRSLLVPLCLLVAGTLSAGAQTTLQLPERPSSSMPAATPPKPASTEPMPEWPSEVKPSIWDWVQLTSKEWLKGDLLGMYDEELEFDSAEMELQKLEWDDVYEIRTARVMEVSLTSGEVVVGNLILLGPRGEVTGQMQRQFKRSEIITITPWTSKGKSYKRWSGKLSAGVTVNAGNVSQVDANVKGEAKRRSAHDRVLVEYIANVSRTDEQDIADNQRLNGKWDHFVTQRFFVKPVVIEVYRDPFLNLDSRSTAGAGLGYQFIDTKRTEWEVSTGLGYQSTTFSNVGEGEESQESTAAFSGSTRLEQDWTKAIEFNFEYTFHIVNETSGRFTHHMVMGFETDWWKDALDFDVTLIWDRTQNPTRDAEGVLPKQDDFRMVLGLGIEF